MPFPGAIMALAAVMIAALASVRAASADAGDALATQAADPLLDPLRERVELLAAGEFTPAIALAVVRPGRDDLLLTQGVPYRGAKIGIDEHTVFRLASVSKGFAATLCALLADAGYLALDQAVVDLVPGLELADPAAASALTLERLLSHQTGLPHHTFDANIESFAPLADLIPALKTVRPTCAVGECYTYQNVIFNVAADAAFNAAGTFFEQELRRRLLLPLGMDETSVGREALIGASNWARPHVRGKRGWTVVEPKSTYYQLPAAAGVNSSIRDVAIWMRAQLGERPEVLPPEVLRTVQKPRVETPNEIGSSQWRRQRLQSARYALGWRVFDYAGETLVFHAGAVQGYRAMVGLLPEHGFGVALLWNSDSSVPSGLMATALDRLLGLEGPDWLESDKLRQQLRWRQTAQSHGRRSPGSGGSR
jgi:beta-lactamase class C